MPRVCGYFNNFNFRLTAHTGFALCAFILLYFTRFVNSYDKLFLYFVQTYVGNKSAGQSYLGVFYFIRV